MIRRSRRSVDVATPYLVPPARTMRALERAARRGVAVRLLVAGLSDVPMVTLAARHVYGRLLRSGVRIHEVHATTLHAKVAIGDGVYAMVGSFNLDQWSDRRNLEVTVGVVSPRTVADLGSWFEGAVGAAQEITVEWLGRRSLADRLKAWVAYVLLRA